MNCKGNAVLFAPETEIAATCTRSEQNTDVRLLSRDSLLCAALVMVCIVAAWPFAQIGINDDWSYILTTQTFVQTHHFVYNGWATAMVGWQVLWGAVFAWLVRSDFIGIRLSTIPVAMATAVLFRAILRNFGLNRAHAFFGTLVLTLGPVFLALSATFMTDIPGLFGIFLCIYLCQRALIARNDSHAALWLAAAAFTNIAAGTVRQVTWLGVLVIVPCCAWLLRRRRYIVPLTLALWIVSAVSIKLLLIWFFRHPYSIPLTLIPRPIDAAAINRLFRSLGELVTTPLLYILPVLVAGVAARWPPRKRQVFWAAAFLLILVIAYVIAKRMGYPLMSDSLWAGNIVTPFGIMQGPELFWSSHRVSPRLPMALFGIVVLCAVSFFTAISRPRIPPIRSTEAPRLDWRTIFASPVALFSLLLFPALPTRPDRSLRTTAFAGAHRCSVDLHPALAPGAHRVTVSLAIATATVVVVAILGVAATHDLFAMARAEVRLTNALQRADVPEPRFAGA